MSKPDLSGPSHIVYLDESMERNTVVIAALLVPVPQWLDSLDRLVAFRRELKSNYGIYMKKEIHAWKLLSGRGRISDHYVSKEDRAEVFRETLRAARSLPGAKLFSVVATQDKVDWAYERLMNRIQRNLLDCSGTFVMLCDQGKEFLYTQLSRSLRRKNHIQSKYGTGYLSVPVTRLVEDPVFLRSDNSYFVQVVDCCAYALLRNEKDHPTGDPFSIKTTFRTELEPICVKEANPADDLGIIRVK